MAKLKLTEGEQLALSEVLELHPNLTRKGTPALQPLSFYSSELKGLKQIAGLLDSIRNSGKLTDNPITRARYFNTLSNQGLVAGAPDAPILTPAAKPYLAAWDTSPDDDFWRDSSNGIDLETVRSLVNQMTAGGPVSEVFKNVWFNAQTFFDSVPPTELDTVLSDKARLLFLFHINSVGWEIARYFRLPVGQRKVFEDAFQKVLPTDEWSPSTPIEIAAASYKDAAKAFQVDIRFRISGFLNAYRTLRDQLRSTLPRLDRQMVLRAGTSSGAETKNLAVRAPAINSALPLPHPHQLIVTGCPGSGKSYFVDQLIATAQCQVFRTQFHSESSFFDFVGAYKPQPVYESADSATPLFEGDGSTFSRGRPMIDYRFVPGPLMLGLSHAYKYPSENVVVLIEELNRGNATAILGDMLQLLDRNDAGTSRYDVLATPEIRAYFAQQGISLGTIRLPSNLYLWATMNSADQGVFPLDTAFRRRWQYIYKGYTEPCRYPLERARIRYGNQTYAWDTFRSAINQHLVSLGIHEDKLIGPYFLTEQQLAEPQSVLEKLFLYLWDDVLRFRQDTLFTAKSFSMVAADWSNGMGTPLNLDLPLALDDLSTSVEDDAAENPFGGEPTESSVASDPMAGTEPVYN